MNYIHPIAMNEIWQDVHDMVSENYLGDFESNDIISIGTAAFQKMHHLREEFPNFEKYISYQLEPLTDDHWHSKEKIIENLHGADEVWDYDLENINVLKEYGINAKYKPFLYTESLKRVHNCENPDIDILFYGTLTKERLEILRIISDYFNIVILRSFTGKKLDEFIARSKIILDLHTTDGGRQKQSRIFYALMNNKCVLSEKSNSNHFMDLIIEADSSQMIGAINLILKNGIWKNYSNVSERFKLLSQSIKEHI